MKILHVIISMAESLGGPPRGLAVLAEAQAKNDQVAILPGSDLGGQMVIEPGEYENLRVFEPPVSGSLKFPQRKLTDRIYQEVEKADVVHIHSNWRWHFIAASRAALKFNKPYVIRPAGNLGFIPRKSKAYLKIPYLKIVEQKYFKKASAVQCCTKKEFKELDLFAGINKIVIPQPVDDDLLKLDADFEDLRRILPGLKEDTFKILFLGRFAWIKNLPLLLRSFVELQSKSGGMELVMAGPWEDRKLYAELREMIKQADMEDCVHLPGMVTGKQKAALLRAADVFVCPSEHENFGLSVAEALLFDKPCIVNKGVALSEEIEEFSAGLVFTDSKEELKKCIETLYSDKEVYSEIKLNARKISSLFRAANVAEKLREEYIKMLRDV